MLPNDRFHNPGTLGQTLGATERETGTDPEDPSRRAIQVRLYTRES